MNRSFKSPRVPRTRLPAVHISLQSVFPAHAGMNRMITSRSEAVCGALGSVPRTRGDEPYDLQSGYLSVSSW